MKILRKILRLIFWRKKSFSESLVIQIASFFQAFAVSLGADGGKTSWRELDVGRGGGRGGAGGDRGGQGGAGGAGGGSNGWGSWWG
jgi:hypothetical protein